MIDIDSLMPTCTVEVFPGLVLGTTTCTQRLNACNYAPKLHLRENLRALGLDGLSNL